MTQPENMDEAAKNDQSYSGEDVDLSYLVRMSRRKKLPIIRQIEAAECGLACIAMVLGYYGHHVSLAELRRRFSISVKGSTLSELIRYSDALGLTARPVRLEIDEIEEVQTPCILHWNMDHFVVLKEVSREYLHIHDPGHGARRIALKDAISLFTGVALELGQGPSFQRKAPAPALSLRALAGSVRGIGSSLRNIFGFAVVLEIVSLLMPQFMQIVVDQVLADSDHDLLMLLGTSFVLLVIVQTAISAFRTWSVVWLSTHFTMNWTGNVFQHLMRLPQIYFLKRHLGDIVSRLGAITAIQQSLTSQLVGAIIDGMMAVATFIMLTIYSPLLSCLVAAGTAIYAVLRMAYFKSFQEANLSQIVVNARQQTSLMESVRGVQTIRLNNKGPARSARYLNQTAEALNTQVQVQRLTLVFTAMNGLTSGLQRVGVLWLGAWLALRGDMSAGMLMAFAAYSDQFATRATAFADYVIQLRLLRLQGERLADIVLSAPEPFAQGSYQGPTPNPSIRFERVSFRYADSEPWIIHNCSFEVSACESVAIVGPSGSGKSTLLRLMLGLVDPQIGKIYVGGVELAQLGKSTYRDMVGSVLQDDKLFAGSVADNICFFDDDARPEIIQDAARSAELHDDICTMPMGYHTLVGDMGSTLSGGQQQRLLLARALYRKPSILILDEATSHLDLPRERKIASLLQDMAITRIIVAHRPETVATAARVLVLAGGMLLDRPMNLTDGQKVAGSDGAI
ncbi:colicin V processing peptidase [Luteibacter rhizovicinus]|uniref:Colicin V processing peptidase n=1 Tax=Luteibacter rhizovicinus TaxID=242606 RepID=A0A4R3YJ90_9GAMM|nr:peptidase domain-containing ABC transporter [Luteibacter rhizovicinus]TCV92122.1 colicin V processing peptidase [Luteibacter rhizovicinus]